MKGFLFSTEATIAIILIALMATTLWGTTPNNNNQNPINTRTLNLEAMSVYFNENIENEDNQVKNQTCSKIIYYDSVESEDRVKIIMKTKIVCEK